MKVLVVYWSGTGNTEAMANAVYEGAKESGADVELCNVSEVTDVSGYDVVLMGCPAMGAEELEPDEFEPFFEANGKKLTGKKIGLFGSYDWGDGEWMRTWQSRVEELGGIMLMDGIIANNSPDDSVIEECKMLGNSAAK